MTDTAATTATAAAAAATLAPLGNLGNLLKQLPEQVVQPLLNSFFTNINSNPSVANVAAQATALEVSLVAALPNLESLAIKDVAAVAQEKTAELTHNLATGTTAAATAATGTATAG